MKLLTKSGQPVHPIGIGTWGVGEHPAMAAETTAEIASIRSAISLGQNHIDTAEMYANGGAERVVGRASTTVDRADLFIASKLWKNHVASGAVRPAVEAMLQRLGTSYLDILYIHAPWFDAPWQEAIEQIGSLIDGGIVRYFGVSNFGSSHLQTTLSATRHPITVNQVHFNVLHQQVVTPELRELCTSNDIALVAHMPLGRGDVMSHPELIDIASRYGVTAAQIALAWLLAKQAMPIPKALQKVHIEQNAAAAAVKLSAEDIHRLDMLADNNGRE